MNLYKARLGIAYPNTSGIIKSLKMVLNKLFEVVAITRTLQRDLYVSSTRAVFFRAIAPRSTIKPRLRAILHMTESVLGQLQLLRMKVFATNVPFTCVGMSEAPLRCGYTVITPVLTPCFSFYTPWGSLSTSVLRRNRPRVRNKSLLYSIIS